MNAPPKPPPKFTYRFPAEGHAQSTHSFSTAAELRDALLAAYPGAHFFNGPVVGISRTRDDIDVFPAWQWLYSLLRTRSDWWPAVGLAIQHAVREGGDLARRALCDFLCVFPDQTLCLLPWTTPLAKEWPDVVPYSTFQQSGVDMRLGAVVDRQAVRWDERQIAGAEIRVVRGSKEEILVLRTSVELESALVATAEGHVKTPGSFGPWGWLVESALSQPWMHEAIPAACAKLVATYEPGNRASELRILAMLSWFQQEFDLWRYRDLFDGWKRTPPAWWTNPLPTDQPGEWSNALVWVNYHGIYERLGELFLLSAGGRAQAQLESPPTFDLKS